MRFFRQNFFTEFVHYFHGGEPVRYRCSQRSVTDWYKIGTRSTFLGFYNALSGTIFGTFWIIIIFSITRRNFIFKASCLKLVLFIGFVNLFTNIVTSFWPAYMFYTGGVFCTNPLLSVIIGKCLVWLWISGSGGAVLFSVSQLSDIMNVKRFKLIFESQRKSMQLIYCVIFYGLFVGIISDPLLFNSTKKSFLLNPFNGVRDVLFSNAFIEIHDSLFLISILFLISFKTFFIWKNFENSWKGISTLRRQLLVYSIIFPLNYLVPSTFYIFLTLFTAILDYLLFPFSQIWFQLSSGIGSIVLFYIVHVIRVQVLHCIGLQRAFFQKVLPSQSISSPQITV